MAPSPCGQLSALHQRLQKPCGATPQERSDEDLAKQECPEEQADEDQARQDFCRRRDIEAFQMVDPSPVNPAWLISLRCFHSRRSHPSQSGTSRSPHAPHLFQLRAPLASRTGIWFGIFTLWVPETPAERLRSAKGART